MTLAASVWIALCALRTNTLRTGLAMLGIIIGVGAFIASGAIGAGAQARIADQIRSLGSNLIIVLSGSVHTGGIRLGSGTQLSITEDDATAITREVPAVLVAAPSLRGAGQVVYGNQNWSTTIQGVTPDYEIARECATPPRWRRPSARLARSCTSATACSQTRTTTSRSATSPTCSGPRNARRRS